MRSGKRKVGETLPSLRSTVNSQSCYSSQSRVSMVSGCSLSWVPERFDPEPSFILLSMTSQEALTLKWAREQGVNIDLALRSPGDNEVFVTTSVSLPQIIDQGGLAIPEPIDFDLYDGS